MRRQLFESPHHRLAGLHIVNDPVRVHQVPHRPAIRLGPGPGPACFVERPLQFLAVDDASPCAGGRFRPPLPIVRRLGTHCLVAVAKVPVAENPLSSWMTTSTHFERVRMSGSNPFSFVAALFPQLGQHTGGFLSGTPSIRMPEGHLREVALVSPPAIGMPEADHPSYWFLIVHLVGLSTS